MTCFSAGAAVPKNGAVMRALFIAAVAGLPFAIFMLATWLRRVRWRKSRFVCRSHK